MSLIFLSRKMEKEEAALQRAISAGTSMCKAPRRGGLGMFAEPQQGLSWRKVQR